MRLLITSCCLLLIAGCTTVQTGKPGPSFAEFDRKAKAGESLTVVYFGASLTWGANASDPVTTSYRGDVSREFEKAYPNAHFRFIDAAIGGTGSQLGVFRLQRDVLRYQPDLVFLDFSANDDIYQAQPEQMASYESLVRRMVLADIPVVQVVFPFKWNARRSELPKMAGRDGHYKIHEAYHTGIGDAVELVIDRLESGKVTMDEVWDLDGVHPGDAGYQLFADAAWAGYRKAVKDDVVCEAPGTMLFGNTYMSWSRVRLATLSPLPAGWRAAEPNRTSAWYDALMTRWLDSEVVASNRQTDKGGPTAKLGKETQAVEPLRLEVQASMIMVFGEETLKSGQFKVLIDGKPATHYAGKNKPPSEIFNASASRAGGNTHLTPVIATGLDASKPHLVEIVPVFSDGEPNELRIESLCAAGGPATVKLAK